jgi:hypothetical protein
MRTPPIFLSASGPTPERSNNCKWSNFAAALQAFCAHALAHFPVVFGGHPTTTPIVHNVAQFIAHASRPKRDALRGKPQILTFRSACFFDGETSKPEGAIADDVVVTDAIDEEGKPTPARSGDRRISLLYMRYEMIGRPTSQPICSKLQSYAPSLGSIRKDKLKTFDFSAGVFIGGAEGVEREFSIFRSFHPSTPALPIASAGSVCVNLLEQVRDQIEPEVYHALRDETAYSWLMREILPPPNAAKMIQWRAAAPR